MNSPSQPKPKATEERLQQIKTAAATATPPGAPRAHPQIQGRDSYYNLPALKPPVWTWEVPLYFFLGGISGLSECMAFAAQIFRADPALIRALLWIALIGAAICPTLLIADLGRPTRFLNMLRVFKLQSPMSLGAWILVAFSGCAFLSLASHELILYGFTAPLLVVTRWLGEFSGTITGFLLAGYTGVLIGATAIPVWLHNRKILPAHFLTSGLGGSAAILELLGFFVPATQILGYAASGIETALEVFFEVRKPAVNAPLHHGKSGAAFIVAGILEGPAALLIRIFAGSNSHGRQAAAIAFLAGSLLSRYAWIWAGRTSARDVTTQFQSQRQNS
jgi:formate-dependent nitrite reductase membrane component NrfD